MPQIDFILLLILFNIVSTCLKKILKFDLLKCLRLTQFYYILYLTIKKIIFEHQKNIDYEKPLNFMTFYD